MTTDSTGSSRSRLGLPAAFDAWRVKATPATLVFWGLAALVIVVMTMVHDAAGMTLPAPWGDEAFFVWQARAFERWNSFVAPEIDGTRTVLILPFVYQTVLGTAFKLFGYSLDLARDISLLFTIAGFILMALVAKGRPAPIAALVLIGAFMLNGHFIAMANNARMEAVLFAVVCGALLLTQAGRVWIALAVLSVSPMIHPNGVLFLIPAMIYAVFSCKVHRTKPSRTALVILGASFLVWLANGLYAISQPDSLMRDIAYRFAETSGTSSGWSQFGGWHGFGLLLIVATGVVGAWRKARIGHFIVFAIGSWLMYRVRVEQWYEVFGNFAYLLLSLAILELTAQHLPSLKTRFGAPPRWAMASGVAIALLGLHVATGAVQGPKNYIGDLNVNGMRVATDNVDYFTAEDQAAITSYIRTRHKEGGTTLEVYPWGDSLLITGLEGDGVQMQIPYFDPAFSAGGQNWLWGYGPTLWPTADVYLIRASRYQPRWLDERLKRVMARAEARTNRQLEIIHSRDGTEIWYAVRAPTS